ncbi:MAG: PAS domain S-box protein [Thermoleophilia bacterium]
MNTHQLLTWKRHFHLYRAATGSPGDEGSGPPGDAAPDAGKKWRFRIGRGRKAKRAAIGVGHHVDFKEQTRQKSIRLMWDLIVVFLVFAVALIFASVFDLHGMFEAASVQLKSSPVQYDEIIVALGFMAAALSAFAVRRWRELEVEIDGRLDVEDALKESEVRYRTLAEAAQDFIFILGRDGRIRYVNSFAASQLGMPADRLVDKKVGEVFPTDVSGLDEADLRQVFENHHLLRLEAPVVLSGKETWQSMSLVPIFDEAGRVDTILGISRDVTERRQAETELKQAHDGLEVTVAERTAELESLNQKLETELEERRRAEDSLHAVNRALRTAMASNHALVSASAEPELLRQICRAVVEAGGYQFAWVGFAVDDPEKMIRPVATAGYEKGYLEATRSTWDDSALGRGPSGKAIRSGLPSVVRDVDSDPDFRPWKQASTARGFASVVALPLGLAEHKYGVLNIYSSDHDAFDDGEVALLSELAGDLSYGLEALRTRGERDQQALTLRRTGEQLSLLVQSLPIIFYTSEAEGDFGITYVSNNVRELAGYKPAQITGDPVFWPDRIHPDDAPRIFEESHKVFDQHLHEYEYRWRTAGGTYKWFLDVHRLVKSHDGSGDTYIVGMWLDISARKSGEEALLRVKEGLELDVATREEQLHQAEAMLAERERELGQARTNTRLLAGMEEMLQSCLAVPEAFGIFSHYASELLPASSGAVYMLDPDSGRFNIGGEWGENPPKSRTFAPDDCWSLRQQRPHVVMEKTGGTRCRHADPENAYACIPMKAGGREIGLISMTVDASARSEEEVQSRMQLAQEAAEHLGATLYNLKLREMLLGSAAGDPFECSRPQRGSLEKGFRAAS